MSLINKFIRALTGQKAPEAPAQAPPAPEPTKAKAKAPAKRAKAPRVKKEPEEAVVCNEIVPECELKAIATLEGMTAGSHFLTESNGRTNTLTIRRGDLYVGGRMESQGIANRARIDSDDVAELHFALHLRKGSFYIEVFSETSVNDTPLRTEEHPWMPLFSGDTVAIAPAGVAFKFTHFQ